MRQRYAGLGSVGLNTDVQPSILDGAAWTVLDNVVCEDGSVRSAYGEFRRHELPSKPTYFTVHRKLSGAWHIVTSDGSTVWMTPMEAPGIPFEITPATGPWPTGYVSFTNLNSQLVVNSDKAGAFWLNEETNKLEPLPDWDMEWWRCREMVAFRYCLVALGMTETEPELGDSLLDQGAWTGTPGWTQPAPGTGAYKAVINPLSHNAAIKSKATYRCIYTITGRTTGDVVISFGGKSTAAVSADGVFTATTSSTEQFKITPSVFFDGEIAVSLKEDILTGSYGPELLDTDGWSIPEEWTLVETDEFFGYQAPDNILGHFAVIELTKKYKLVYTIAGRTAGTVNMIFGGGNTGPVSVSGDFSVTATTTQVLWIVPTADFNGSMTFSLKEETAPGVFGNELLTAEGWAIPVGWTQNPAGTFTYAFTPLPLVRCWPDPAIGAKYRVEYTIRWRTAGSLTIHIGGVDTAGLTGSGTFDVTALDYAGLAITPTADFDGGLNILVKRETYPGVFSSGWIPKSYWCSIPAGWTETEASSFEYEMDEAPIFYSLEIESAKTYVLDYTIADRTAGTVNISFGDVATGDVSVSGTKTGTTTSSLPLTVTPSKDFVGKVTVALKQDLGGGSYTPDLLSYWFIPVDWDQDPADTFTFKAKGQALFHSAKLSAGQTYKATYTVTGRTAGDFVLSFGGQVKPGISGNGEFVAEATNADRFSILPSADFNGTVGVTLQRETADGVFGSNLLGASGWTIPTGWTKNANGTLRYSYPIAPLQHTVDIAVGTDYFLEYQITDRNAGSVTISMGGKTVSGVTESGKFRHEASTTDELKVTPTIDFDGTIALAFRKILGSVTREYPHKLRWSASADDGAVPAQWVPSLENDAGDDLLGETQGHIVGGTLMRDALFVIKEDAAYSMTFTGGQFVMRVDRLHGAVGTQLQKGYVEMRGALVTCSTRDLVAFDGHTATSMAAGRIREALQDTISDVHWNATKVFRHNPTTTLWICGSSRTVQLDSALVFNWTTGVWYKVRLNRGFGVLALPVSSGDKPLTEIGIIEGDESNTAWWVSVLGAADTNSDGTPKTCTAERIGLSIEGADGIAMIREAWLDYDGTEALTVTLGVQDRPDGPVTWGTPEVLTPGASLTPRLSGRFIALRLQSQGVGWWKVGALTIDWAKQGLR